MSDGVRIELTRNALHEGTWGTLVNCNVEAIHALLLLGAIVAQEVRPSDSFHERVERFFAFLSRSFGAHNVFLQCCFPASGMRCS